ncbi:MAG: indolepyruvate oxidoreductase subunit beta [Thermoplasmataceae archaeon]
MRTNIIIAGVGGQGVVTAGMLLSEAATLKGMRVVMSEIHGLAQRGGSVSVDVRIGDVYGSIIGKGDADLIIGFEPIETMRAIARAGNKTQVIMNSEKITPVSLSMHDKEYPSNADLMGLADKSIKIREINAVSLAKKAGSYKSVNTVIIGAAIGLGILPFTKEDILSALKNRFSGKLYDINREALAYGMDEILTNQPASFS